jgi:hypothetical protein
MERCWGRRGMTGDDSAAALTPAPALYVRVCSSLLHGWRFWSLDGVAPANVPKAEKAAQADGQSRVSKRVRQIRKLPNQRGVPEGETRWFCSGCMKGFLVPVGQEPDACPEGHPAEVEDAFASAE